MRTTKGAARNQAKNRLFKKTKGYAGGRGTLLRTAKETLVRAGAYRLPRSPRPQARVPQAVDHPHQRRRPRARPALQRVHRRPEEGRHRARSQDALRNGGRTMRRRSTPWSKRPAKRWRRSASASTAGSSSSGRRYALRTAGSRSALSWHSPNFLPSSMRSTAARARRSPPPPMPLRSKRRASSFSAPRPGELKDAQQGLGARRQGRQAGGGQAVQRGEAGRRSGVRGGAGAAGRGR